jgi:hypothetical protein
MRKFLGSFAILLLTSAGIVGVSLPAQAGSLEVLGATVTWDEASLFEPTGCSSFNFRYVNGTGLRLLQLEFQVKSRFGDSVVRESQIGIPAGTSGQWRVQVCKSELIDGLGPYSTELSIEDYDGTVRTATGTLSFKSRNAPAAPTRPAPAVPVTPPLTAVPSSSLLPGAKNPKLRKVTSPGSAPEDLVEMAPKIRSAVVTVICASGQGSGWSAAITPSQGFTAAGNLSYIITNHHVVEDCLRVGAVTVRSQTGENYPGRVIAFDAENDLAGIAIASFVPALDWQGEMPAQAWWVGVMGSPKGVTGVLTTGIVSKVNPATSILNLTAPLNPGNSGGPAFDRDGRVIAIVSAKYTATEGFGIAQGANLLCVKIMKCPSGTSSVWATTGLVETSAPTNGATSAPSLRSDQKTLKTFQGGETKLTSQQRNQIAQSVSSNPNAEKFVCTGIRLASQPTSANIVVRKRAKAACDYAKTLNPVLATWVQTKPTTARSFAGKVLLTIKSPSN